MSYMLYTAQLVLASRIYHLVLHILGKRMRLEEARSLMQVSGALETRLKTSMSHHITFIQRVEDVWDNYRKRLLLLFP